MEQGSRLDSTPVSAGHDTTGHHDPDRRRDAAITKMLTAGATRDAAGRFAKRSAAPQPAPDLGEVARENTAPRGTVPAPADAPEGTYGLVVRDGGLGLHAAPGASILVAPEVPAGAGLAVFYLWDASGPVIYDLTHGFRPEFAPPFAPGSEVMPAIEVVQPGTGRSGHLQADRIEKIHRVLGVYSAVDLPSKYGPRPPKLRVMSECPDGMGEHHVDDTGAYPLVRRGETVVYDPSRRDPTHGALCVLQWNNGTRSVMLTNQRTAGSVAGKWWVDPVNRPANREALERQASSGSVGVLHMSDGPYDVDHLRQKIVGTVVGILVPRRQPGSPAGDPAPGSDRAAAAALATTVPKDTTAAIGTALDDVGLNSKVSEEVCAAIEEHAEAIAASRAETDDSDEAFDSHAAHELATDKALREAPVRSLADLRAKLTYLVPIIAPDMLDQTHVEYLKAIRDDVDRLCRQTAPIACAASGSAVATAIRLHEEAYGQRLYAETGRLPDADVRASEERVAFRSLLHTQLKSDADRLAYAQTVIGRAAGVYGSECENSGRGAWMPTAYRNLAYGEWTPESEGSRISSPLLAVSTDPVFAAIAANRRAEADVEAFGERAPQVMNADLRAEEDALVERQCATREAAWTVTPTTRAGRLALVEFAKFQAENIEGPDWRTRARVDMIFGDCFLALAAAIEAETLGPVHSEAATEASLDFQDASVSKLARLYDHLHGIANIASMACNAPMAWDDLRENLGPVGRFLEEEHVRLDGLIAQVVAAIRARVPNNDGDRDDRLATLVKREMEENARIADAAVLTAIATTWSA